MSQRARRTASTAVAAVAVALLVTACSGGDDPSDPGTPAAASSASEAPDAVATTVSFGAVEGKLPRSRRDELAAEVQEVVDEWIDGAYLGDYPRSDFSAAWAGFTPGARTKAERDAGLMSNSDVGAQLDAVEPERRSVTLDVLSVRQRPVGVTAHVVLRFTTTGSGDQDVRVAGRLYLTPGKQGWQVFGYDMTKGAV